ncbi:hypothetical protein V6N11_037998 [Hibiscus sabdariffa]|uniref:Uncharacterized protein n=1 Tax=Hibiscus sabdariffa TaxID=183260 RepID=A0ABR1ZY89_9ROSI
MTKSIQHLEKVQDSSPPQIQGSAGFQDPNASFTTNNINKTRISSARDSKTMPCWNISSSSLIKEDMAEVGSICKLGEFSISRQGGAG